jgi:hypothetical protein
VVFAAIVHLTGAGTDVFQPRYFDACSLPQDNSEQARQKPGYPLQVAWRAAILLCKIATSLLRDLGAGAAHCQQVKEKISPKAAQGIEAEIPQKSHGRFRGIGAESPVFCGRAAKNAP